MKNGIDSLQKTFGKVSEKIYQQSQQNAGPGPDAGAGFGGNAGGGQNADGSYDAEFTDKTGEN